MSVDTLVTLLAANPTVKVEYDVAIALARTEGATEAREEMKAVVDKITPILTSAEYGADVKEAGIKAIIGTGPVATFETLVVLADRDTEAAKAKAAKKESDATGDTTGAGGGDDAADAEAKAAYEAKKARLKEGVTNG